MALVIVNPRRSEKTSTVAGATPTIAPTLDHTDGSWNALDCYPSEIFFNDADELVYIMGTSGPIQIGGFTASGGESLAQTLAIGNFTSGNDIRVSTGDLIKPFSASTAEIDMNWNSNPGYIRISHEGATQSYLAIDASSATLAWGNAHQVVASPSQLFFNSNGWSTTHLTNRYTISSSSQVIFRLGMPNTGIFSTGATLSSILSTRGLSYSFFVENSVAIGGSGLSMSHNNTAYVDNFNIKTVDVTSISGGTATTLLAVDSNGYVVDGSSLAVGSTAVQTPQSINPASPAWNVGLGYNAYLNLNGAGATVTVSGTTAGDYGNLVIHQGPTGGNYVDFAGANNKFPGGTFSFSAGASAEDIYTFYFDGSDYFWNYSQNYS